MSNLAPLVHRASVRTKTLDILCQLYGGRWRDLKRFLSEKSRFYILAAISVHTLAGGAVS